VHDFQDIPARLSTVAICASNRRNGVEILRELCPGSTRVLASDLCSVFIDTQAKHLPNVKFTISSAEQFPYPREWWDRYVADLALKTVPRPEQMLAEAFRVLQPGESSLLQPAFEAAARSGSVLPPPTARSNFHLAQPQILRDLFLKAGFRYPLIVSENSFLPFLRLKTM